MDNASYELRISYGSSDVCSSKLVKKRDCLRWVILEEVRNLIVHVSSHQLNIIEALLGENIFKDFPCDSFPAGSLEALDEGIVRFAHHFATREGAEGEIGRATRRESV